MYLQQLWRPHALDPCAPDRPYTSLHGALPVWSCRSPAGAVGLPAGMALGRGCILAALQALLQCFCLSGRNKSWNSLVIVEGATFCGLTSCTRDKDGPQ